MKGSLSIPHDGLFKKFMSNVTLAKAFLEVYLPPSIKQYCDFNTLQIANGSFVDANLRQYFSDIVYTLNIAGAPGYIHAVIEHESVAGQLTPFKLLRYQTGVMQQYLDQGNKSLPVVAPLIFYRGQTSPYPGPIDLLDCFENRELAQKIFLKPVTLIDLSIIPDEEIQTHKSIAAFELLQKHIHTRDFLQLAQKVLKMLRTYPPPDEIRSGMLEYLVEEGRCIDHSKFIQLVTEIAPNYREEIMTLGQQLRFEGERKATLEIAKTMLATGMPVDKIKELTKLSDQDLAESMAAL